MLLDLSKPPYFDYVRLCYSLVDDQKARERVAFSAARNKERGEHDANELERARVTQLLRLGVAKVDLSLVRFLLDQEIEARRSDSYQGAGDTLAFLSTMLIDHADADDVWRFFLAKTANFDTCVGGYDIEFVFATPLGLKAMGIIRDRASSQDLEFLSKYNAHEIMSGISEWRSRRLHSASSASDIEILEAQMIADLFGDIETVRTLGLASASTAEDRARVLRRTGDFNESYPAWCEAAKSADQAWDKVSYLCNAMKDAINAGITTTKEAVEIDSVRHHIASWREVGLGRMTAQATFEMAALTDDPNAGILLWSLADGWASQFTNSMPLAGLRCALSAAERWGSPDDVVRITRSLEDEKQRLRDMGIDPM